MTDETYHVTVEEATAMLPHADSIRCCYSVLSKDGAGIHLLAAWDRQDLIECMRKNQDTLQLSGPVAAASGYGLAVWFVDDWLFIETPQLVDK